MRKISWILLVFTVLLLFTLESCKTYFIPIDSFKKQFDEIDSTSLKTVYAKGPAGDIVEYLANPLEYIKCVDKNNKPFELKNSPSIEIRFTRNNDKRTIFYFDYIFIQDSNVVGDMSRFYNMKRTIPLNDIKRIEVQDGRKNFKYVDKKGK